MPIYRCDRCGCVENTALSNFWTADYEHKPERLCSECDPEIGAWHGEFQRQQWHDSVHKKNSGMLPEILERWTVDKRKAVAAVDPHVADTTG